MNILITGYNGFIGKNLSFFLENKKNIKIFKFGKNNNLKDLENYVKKCEIVFHLAGENRNKEQTQFINNNFKLTRDLVNLIIQSSIISILSAILIIFFISWIFYRSLLWAFFAILPLSAAVILNFGLMGLFGIKLSHVTAILSSIIIGVGVDFAIHYIAAYRITSKENTSMDKVTQNAINDVGYPIILDAGSNMAFGALLFSSFVPVQYIGGLMVFAMISTSLGTLTILAASTEIFKGYLYEK